MRTRIRAWFHWRGVHTFCRIKYEARYRELIRSKDDDEVIDVTNQSALGRVVHF